MRNAIAVAIFLLLGACGSAEDGIPERASREQPALTDSAEPAGGSPELVAGLALPATFIGTLPCADCEGIRYHLDLWPDGVFHLRRQWLGTSEIQGDRGRWREAPDRAAIFLDGSREAPLGFEVKGPDVLRMLDLQGNPIQSDLPYDLVSQGTLTPVDLSLGLHGMFRYMADAARFQECLTGRDYPVAMAGDYIAMERAYLQANKPEPGAPLMAVFEGEISLQPPMEGSELVHTVSVRRFIGLFPDQTCERSMSVASLSNTYWKIVRLGDEAVVAVEGSREPHLLLRGGQSGYSATAGCNQFAGSYQVEGEHIEFHSGPGTLMACQPLLAALEDRLLGVLSTSRSWAIYGQVLELFDEGGASVAAFEAVYLP